MAAKTSSPGAHGSNLREEAEQMNFLEKENFDLKMRVYYLEESMTGGMGSSENDGGGRSRQNSARHLGPGFDGDASLKISELQLELEEKKAELEQRNLLLTKSKEMMEKMKGEMVDIRKDADPRGREEMQESIDKLKRANEDLHLSLEMRHVLGFTLEDIYFFFFFFFFFLLKILSTSFKKWRFI